MNDFVHLHVHSEYSLLDGLGRTSQLAAEAARLGQPSLALTDHGVMHGAIEFFRNCQSKGVKPIIGVETYLTPFGRRMTDRDPVKDKKRHHLLLLAYNMSGYKNLIKICSESQMTGFYHKPRIDADYLAAHADGLICTTGCMAAEIPALLNSDEGNIPQPEKAMERLQWYLDVFGPDRFFVELQEHDIPALTLINKTLFEWANQYQLGLVVTNDVHYVTAKDASAHDALLCVQTNSLLQQQKRMRMPGGSYYLKSLAEMQAVFRPLIDLPESAFSNTVKIAEMCELNLEDSNFHLPDLPADAMPAGYNYETFLRHLTDEGLKKRYGARADSPEVQTRKEHELSIINRMGFSIYYLIVWDLCEYARRRNIWWNVRGSGAGSIVAYAVGITLIDPLQHNLIFERFLNPGRVSMPDFDLDYPDDQREELIRYTIERYGSDRVAQIVSFGRMKARAAIRDVGRAMDVPLSEVDGLAKQVSAIPGKPVTINNVLDAEHEFYSAELKMQYENSPHVKELIDYARNLEGVARHASIHAAAVIVTDKPLTEYLPIMRPPRSVGNGEKKEEKKEDKRNEGEEEETKKLVAASVTQFEFPICESIGLLKIDFLGLSTLTIMRKAAELIKARHGIEYNLENMHLDDPTWQPLDPKLGPDHLKKSFDLLSSGNVTGIFQVESSGMRRILTDMRPTKFEHIVAAISLYRPGPMEYIPTYIKRMHGEEPIEYKHPKLEAILGETYGIIVYQEDLIRIARDLAGYSPGDADQIRKAVGKKIKSKIDEHRVKFVNGAEKQGIARKISESIWDDIEFFARYGFNKCLVGETEIIDAQTGRLVTIEALYRGQAKIEQTITCDTDALKLTSGQVTAVLDNGLKPVYRLTTALGHEIEATANHPFYTFEGWQQLDQLNLGDLLAIPRMLPVEGTDTWPDYQVIVLGHLLAEGNLCHSHSIYYYTQDETCLQDYCQAIEQFENVSCSISWHKNTHSVYAKRLQRDQEPGVVIWAKKLGIWGKDAHAKEIPADVFSLNNQQIALLLGRMWTGDGHFAQQAQNNNYIHAYYATASKRLAQQVQHLLLRLGVVSRLRQVEFPYKEGRTGYQVHVLGVEHMARFAQTVGAHLIMSKHQVTCQAVGQANHPTNSGTHDIVPLGVKEIVRQAKDQANITWSQLRAEAEVAQREFSPTHNTNKRGFRRETISQLAGYFDNAALRRYAESDIYWDKIISIEYIGEKQTYDLTIADTHNFVANNILVHNSHASDYALVTCQTAYLKAHYPIEYMTALLTVERNNTDKLSMLVGECRAMNIKVLPPHLDHSRIDFVIEDEADSTGAIRFGMSAIKNVGEGPVEAILAVRDEHGAFKDLEEFCRLVDLRQVNRRGLEGLIKVGALDHFTSDRGLLLAVIDRMLNFSGSTHKAASAGQISLFGGGATQTPHTESIMHPLPDYQKISERDVLGWEKELVGTYLSNHPMQKFLENIKATNITLLSQLDQLAEGQGVAVAGMVNSARPHQTKKGDAMAFVEIEDMDTMCEVVVFPSAYKAHQALLTPGNLIIVRGKVDTKGHAPKILADTISKELVNYQAAGDSSAPPPKYPTNGKNGHNNGHGKELAEQSLAYQPAPAVVKPSPVVAKSTNPSPAVAKATPSPIINKPTLNPSPAIMKPAPSPIINKPTPRPPTPDPRPHGHPTRKRVNVRIPCTGDPVKDKHRLRIVFDQLTQTRGEYYFRFYIPDGDKDAVIDFPNNFICYSPDLKQQLNRLFNDPSSIWEDEF